MNRQRRAHLYLLSVTLIWGLSFPMSKWMVEFVSIPSMLMYRFLLAALFCTLVSPKQILNSLKDKTQNIAVLKASFFMGLLMFLAFWFQIEGMKYTSASHSAFITGFYCIFTPLLSVMIGREQLSRKLLISLCISFYGLYILSVDSAFVFNWGDFLTILTALCCAAHIILTDKYSRMYNVNTLNALQLWVMFICASTVLAYHGFPSFFVHGSIPLSKLLGLMFYLSFLCTALTFWVQTSQQKYTSPTYVALILLMEPVFGALSSSVILLEKMTPREFLGAGFILLGLILSQIKFKKR